MKKVAIVTVDFNSHSATHDCLESLQKLDTRGIDLSIIVVDNASREEFVLSSKEKNVVLFRSEKNLGFTGGNNKGITYALSQGADYVLLVNNDTQVDRDLLQELLEVFASQQHVGMVVPKIYFAKGYEYHKEKYSQKDLGHVLWYAGGSIDWANVFSVHRGLDDVDHGQYDEKEKVSFATGCCVLMSRDVLEKVGKFDDRYFLYVEDADLSERVQKAGFGIWYQPTAVVWHKNAASSGSGSALHDYFLTRNRMLFGIKYAPLRTKIALLRESVRLAFSGRDWQKKGIRDYYIRRFGKGSWV